MKARAPTVNDATCSFEGCGRAARARWQGGPLLCSSHYAQARRGVELRPLRTGDAKVPLSLRISREAFERLGPRPGALAATILERWRPPK